MAQTTFGNRTLEQVATALSGGCPVRILRSGQAAGISYLTDGMPVITIPDVRSKDSHYQALIRGYIDHEIAHIRHTDNKPTTAYMDGNPPIGGAVYTVMMIYEDIRVERLLGGEFPGSAKNLSELSDIVYVRRRFKPLAAETMKKDVLAERLIPQNVPYALWTAVSQFVLYTARRFDDLAGTYAAPVEVLAPGLCNRIRPIVTDGSAKGTGTEQSLAHGVETVSAILDYFEHDWKWVDGGPVPDGVMRTLRSVLRDGGLARETVDIGKVAERLVSEYLKSEASDKKALEPAVRRPFGSQVWRTRLQDLDAGEQREALRAAALLGASMQALIQTHVLNRSGPIKIGSLDTRVLHRLSVFNDNVFSKKIRRRRINTEIVLAIDMSGSMFNAGKDLVASKALFAVANALTNIHGLNFSIVGFYDMDIVDIIRPNGRITPRMRIIPGGTTHCGAALDNILGRFKKTRTTRKIVMMITDGETKDIEMFRTAIRQAEHQDVEVLGIGICDAHINSYLPPHRCCVIQNTNTLADGILRMLRERICA